MAIPDPRHYWRFDEGNTTQSTDSVSGAVISFDRASFRPGRAGTALRINPVDGAKVITTSLANRPPPWTVSMWLKREVDTESSALLSSDDFGLKLEQWRNRHTLGLTRFAGTNQSGFDHSSDYVVPLAQWVHLAYVGSATDTKVYVNGVLRTTFAQSISLPLRWIGSKQGYEEFGGFLLDELKIFDQALTSTQVQELAGQSAPTRPPTGPFSGPIHSSSFVQVSSVWRAERFLVSAPNTWVNVPGAKIPLAVGQGTPSLGALFIAVFSAESLVKVAGDNGICWLDITFGGRSPHPQSIITVSTPPSTWGPSGAASPRRGS